MSGYERRYGGEQSGIKYAYFEAKAEPEPVVEEAGDPEYRVVLTDQYGDVTYVKRKSEIRQWLFGINFDVVTNVTVDLMA